MVHAPRLRTPFLGLAFDPIGPNEAARQIAARARKLEPFAYVATPNVDHLVRLDRHPEFLPLYEGAWLNLCDSRILEIIAEISRLHMPAAPGADIVELLFDGYIGRDDAVTVIGASEKVVNDLRSKFGLTNLQWCDAPQGLKNDPAAREHCAAFIRANPAPFVFIAVGSPQQEMIAHEIMAAGNAVGVAICCGASLEFLSGETRRAPDWMRAHRLEWLHRLTSEPARLWQRYLLDGPRILGIWRRWAMAR